jgi:integrase
MPAAKPKGKHPHNRLTAAQVRSLGPGFHGDGGGLYLNVDQGGGRGWILRTIVHGRRRDIGLGPISLIGLADAREEARRLRRVARAGGDPIAERDKDKRRSPTFQEAAEHVYNTRNLPASRKPEAMAQWLGRLKIHAFPALGERQIHTITQADLLAVLELIWLTKPETARRVRQRMAVIFDWARTANHVAGVNPLDGIEAGLPKQRAKVQHRTALPWKDMPALWKRLEGAEGVGALALRFTILTAARTAEVRGMTWEEVDVEASLWELPAERMKMERPHRVPLPPVALALLEKARGLHPRLVFPGSRGKPMSDQTLSAVLRRLDLPVTVHGFRSTFRDWAEEATSYSHEAKELALAHVVKNKVERAYRRGDLVEQRRPMMDDWARFCTEGPPP